MVTGWSKKERGKMMAKNYKDYHTGAKVNNKLVKLRDDWKMGKMSDEKYFDRLGRI